MRGCMAGGHRVTQSQTAAAARAHRSDLSQSLAVRPIHACRSMRLAGAPDGRIGTADGPTDRPAHARTDQPPPD